jgi:glycosyltransferase involved in cell wall biosynthesis
MTRAIEKRERTRVLVLSRNYPNNVMDVLGTWARGQVRAIANYCDVKVISPVPYCPPLPGLPPAYTRFRAIERRLWDNRIESLHPRFIVGPGRTTETMEWLLYDLAIASTVRALRKEFPFDLVHAQFTYPDGVVATRVAKRYGVPAIITEQNLWGPWMNPRNLQRAIAAVRRSDRVIVLTRALKASVESFTGASDKITVIPNGVDASDFTLADNPSHFDPDQILFVGVVRPVKGVDVLLRALKLLADRGRATRLIVVGEAFYGSYQQEEGRLRQMTRDLGIADRVQFVGKKHPPELTRYMQQSAALVLPSHLESLGLVLVEALACGTPVVATRCGGPEDIVNEHVGVLVPPQDADALAAGIEQVLDRRATYDSVALREYALGKFGIDSVAARLHDVYTDVVSSTQRSGR